MPGWEEWRCGHILVRTLHTSKPTGAVMAKRGREELTSWSCNERFFVVAFYLKFL